MYIGFKQLIIACIAYGVIRAGVSIYQEDKARLVAVETAIKELKETK